MTTYTYFIRPYTEPAHEAIQDMVLGPADTAVMPSSAVGGGDDSCSRRDDPRLSTTDRSLVSRSEASSVHSYEVRRV